MFAVCCWFVNAVQSRDYHIGWPECWCCSAGAFRPYGSPRCWLILLQSSLTIRRVCCYDAKTSRRGPLLTMLLDPLRATPAPCCYSLYGRLSLPSELLGPMVCCPHEVCNSSVCLLLICRLGRRAVADVCCWFCCVIGVFAVGLGVLAPSWLGCRWVRWYPCLGLWSVRLFLFISPYTLAPSGLFLCNPGFECVFGSFVLTLWLAIIFLPYKKKRLTNHHHHHHQQSYHYCVAHHRTHHLRH